MHSGAGSTMKTLSTIFIMAAVAVLPPTGASATTYIKGATGNLGDTLIGGFDYSLNGGLSNIDMCCLVVAIPQPAETFSRNLFQPINFRQIRSMSERRMEMSCR